MRAQSAKYKYNADWIAVAGSSAGGHLALLLRTSADVEDLEGRIGGHLEQSSRVQAVIDYFGPADFVLRGRTQPERAYTEKSGSLALMGGLQGGRVPIEVEKRASPVEYLTSDDPPCLIIHGDADEVVLLDQSERMHDACQALRVEATLVVLPGLGHGGRSFYEAEALQRAIDFLNRHKP